MARFRLEPVRGWKHALSIVYYWAIYVVGVINLIWLIPWLYSHYLS